MKKIEILKHIDFNEYITNCFLDFVKQDGNHNVTPKGELYLKEGIEFCPLDVKNRIKKIPERLWKDVLMHHLHYLNYN